MTARISFVILALVVVAGYQFVNSQRTNSTPKTSSSKEVSTFNGFELTDKTGNIRKPADFRDHYELLGTWWVADTTGNQCT